MNPYPNEFIVSFFSDATLEKRIRQRQLTAEEKDTITSIYYQFFTGGLSKTCPDRFLDAYIRIKNLLKNKTMSEIKEHKKRLYHLKRGVAIMYKGNTYTEINLTDEVAKDFLVLHPERKEKFAEVPADEPKEPKVKESKVKEPKETSEQPDE